MGSGGGPSRSTTTQQGSLAPELQPLFEQSSQRVLGLQRDAPVQPFLQPSPLQIAPLSGTQQTALAGIPNLQGIAERTPTGAGLESRPAVLAAQRAFRQGSVPTIVNQATLAGLGRSTALTNALAGAEAQFLLPVIQGELAREERGIERGSQAAFGATQIGLQGGGVERDVAQAGNVASLQDFLRRQAIAETALFQPFGQLIPSGIGQQASTRSSGSTGGAFK